MNELYDDIDHKDALAGWVVTTTALAYATYTGHVFGSFAPYLIGFAAVCALIGWAIDRIA